MNKGAAQYSPEEIRAMHEAYSMDIRLHQLTKMACDIKALCPIQFHIVNGEVVDSQPVLTAAQKGILEQLDNIRISIIETDYPLLINH